MTDAEPRVLFLPGALGTPEFWHPVGERLPRPWEKVYFGWPGLGDQPPDPAVRGFDDLVALVAGALKRPCDDVSRHGAAPWREEYRRAFPAAAGWITEEQPDHTHEIGRISAPTLLLWGDSDPVSPVGIGEQLAGLLPHATLRVVRGGTHSFAHDLAPAVAPLIAAHLE